MLTVIRLLHYSLLASVTVEEIHHSASKLERLDAGSDEMFLNLYSFNHYFVLGWAAQVIIDKMSSGRKMSAAVGVCF